MEIGRVLNYYINYETTVELIDFSKNNKNNYSIKSTDLKNVDALSEKIFGIKKEIIFNRIKSELTKKDKEEFNEFFYSLSDNIVGTEMHDYLEEKIKDKAKITYNEVVRIMDSDDIQIGYPIYNKFPVYIIDCEVNERIIVRGMTAVPHALLLLLCKLKGIDYAEAQIDYDSQIQQFEKYIKSISYQLDIFEIIEICNKEIENTFKIKLSDQLSSYAMITSTLVLNNSGIKEDLISLNNIFKTSVTLPNLLNKYLSCHSNPQELDLFSNNYYYGSYDSDIKVNETQYKILNGLDSVDILAVEGPPGTGKSTMLKELIAKSLVERTEKLILDWDIEWDNVSGIYQVPYHLQTINSIILTSKNRDAIDNVDTEINKEIKYFDQIADKMKIRKDNIEMNPNYQGILCAKLGNQENKNTFFNFFENSFINHIKDYDSLDDFSILKSKFNEIKATLHERYDEIKSISCLYHDQRFTKDNIHDSLKLINSDISNTQETMNQITIKINDLSTNIKSKVKENEDLSYQIRHNILIINEANKNIEIHQELIEKYREYLGLSWMKRTFDPYIRNFLKKNSITLLESQISEFKIKVDEKNKLLEDCKQKESNLSISIEKEKSLLESKRGVLIELENYLNNQNELLVKAEICKKVQTYLKDDFTSYNSFYEIFSDDTLFHQRKELFNLSVKINEEYIYVHKNEILSNFNKFWNGKNVCYKYYNPTYTYANYQIKAIKQLWNTFTLCFPVVTTTLDSFVKYNFQLIPELFDLLLIDESGQILPHAAVPALYRCKKAIVVGDKNQLKPIESIHNYFIRQDETMNDVDLIDHLQISGRSIQVQANEISEIQDNHDSIMLKDHYRCEENIISFSKKYLYPNLICHPENTFEKPFHNNLVMFDIRGVKDKWSHKNIAEAHAIIRLIKQIKSFDNELMKRNTDFKPTTIGVVTPFVSQKTMIESIIKENGYDDIVVGTVHTFQGKQNDCMIMSTVVDDLMDKKKLLDLCNFIGKEPNLLNVALTRAKKQFILVGNYEALNVVNNYITKVLKRFIDNGIVYSMFMNDLPKYTHNFDTNVLNILAEDKKSTKQTSLINVFDKYLKENLVTTPKEHYDLFAESLKVINSSICVCSPWISKYVLNESITELIKKQINLGKDIKLIIGNTVVSKNADITSIVKSVAHYNRIDEAYNLLQELKVIMGDNLRITPPLHSKFLIIDDELMFIGSHNWLSNSGKTNTMELSTLVTDKFSIEYIKKKYLSLNNELIKQI